MLHSTISSHYVYVLLANAQRHIRANELLADSGVPVAILDNPHIRVTIDHFSALLKNVQDVMQDEGIGYYLKVQKIGSTNILINHMSTAETVAEAIEFAADFYDILDLGITLSTQNNRAASDTFSVRVNVDPKIENEWVYEEMLTKIHRIIRWLANERITISKVNMPFAKVAHINEYHMLFGAPISFGQDHAELIFSTSQTNTLIRRDTKDVKQHFIDFRHHMLSLTVDPKSYIEKVRIAIKESLPENCSYENISQKLSMHPQTLRRRLHDEGTEFTTIKNDIIRDLAIDYISKKEHSIKQISFLLNFSAPSSFNRAFKQWTGMTPIEFQSTLNNEPPNDTNPK